MGRKLLGNAREGTPTLSCVLASLRILWRSSVELRCIDIVHPLVSEIIARPSKPRPHAPLPPPDNLHGLSTREPNLRARMRQLLRHIVPAQMAHLVLPLLVCVRPVVAIQIE